MARRLRVHLSSAIYHVMLRGNDGQIIFFSDADRHWMSLLIQEGVERFKHSILAFCFMDNHIHLAIQVNEVSISQIMQNLAFRYASYINSKYDRIGHLFQSRFKSIVVDGDRYLRELIRYIHLNPVRANLVNQPEIYVWSGHRAYLMLAEYTWLNRDTGLKRFGNTQSEAVVNYEGFVLQGIGVDSDLDFKSGSSEGVLGDEEFMRKFFFTVNKVEKPKVALVDLAGELCNHYKVSLEGLCASGKNRLESQIRAILALFVRETKNISMEELAKFLGRDSSGLIKLANRLEKRLVQSSSFTAEIEELRKRIYQMSECPA